MVYGIEFGFGLALGVLLFVGVVNLARRVSRFAPKLARACWKSATYRADGRIWWKFYWR